MKSRIRQNSSSVRLSAEAIFRPSTYECTVRSPSKSDSRSTPGRLRAYLSNSLKPPLLDHVLCGPYITALLDIERAVLPRLGRQGANAWSNSAVTTISTSSVKLIPNRLMKVKNLRRSRTFTASRR